MALIQWYARTGNSHTYTRLYSTGAPPFILKTSFTTVLIRLLE